MIPNIYLADIAVQLREAGYPQRGNGRMVHPNPDCTHRKQPGYLRFSCECWLYIPTLEELIAACGDNILGINRTNADDGTPIGWVADTHTHECDCGKPNCSGFNWEHEVGKTPEEAVAKLWLAIRRSRQTPQ